MSTQTLKIATRKSQLAVWQAEHIKKKLQHNHKNLAIELVKIVTTADKFNTMPLTKIGGKNLFVKELEEAILENRADIAVHSIKDMPSELPPPLALMVAGEREDPRDVFLSHAFDNPAALPRGAAVGTSSLRRQCQLMAIRPDLKMINLRGNVNTRVQKLDQGDYAAIILAAAGIKRLGLEKQIRHYFSPDEFLPAAGQGALGIEYRCDDEQTQALISGLNHTPTSDCIAAERAMIKRLGGSCKTPVAAYATIEKNELVLSGLVGHSDGRLILRSSISLSGSAQDAEQLGTTLAENLLSQGADRILQQYEE